MCLCSNITSEENDNIFLTTFLCCLCDGIHASYINLFTYFAVCGGTKEKIYDHTFIYTMSYSGECCFLCCILYMGDGRVSRVNRHVYINVRLQAIVLSVRCAKMRLYSM